MNHPSYCRKPVSKVSAIITSITYSGDIAIVAFECGDNNRFSLYGDKQQIEPIRAHIGDLVNLAILRPCEWSWCPVVARN